MSRGDLNISRWLEAHSDRSAGLTTLTRNAILADVAGDGDFRLILTDLRLQNDSRSRLRVYKGTLLVSDQVLPDIPSSVIGFYTDRVEPRVPAVAVACGSDLLLYKNTKPFFKFSVPPLPVIPLEADIWKKIAGEPKQDIHGILVELGAIPFNILSARSQQLLSLSPSKIEEFIGKYSGTEPVRTSPITCMTTLNKNDPDKFAVACPIVATEFGTVFVLDPQSFTILHQANACNVKATPSMLNAVGLFDVEFRIIIATRENHICILRRDWVEGKSIIQFTSNIVDMVIIPGDNHIVVATSDKLLHCFTRKGQRLWSSKMINSVTCLCLVPLKHFSTHLVAVGLKGGAVHLYKGRDAVDYTSAPDTPSAITFGQLGQEEHVMVIVTLGGTINFKILKRTADFNATNQDHNAPPAFQGKPLPLPKRSKLFLEQSMRERQNAVDMHQNFQQDLIRLRLTAARSLVQNLTDQTGVGNEKEQVKLSAKVLGLGPIFTIVLSLENMNNEAPIIGLSVVFHANPAVYTLSSYIVQVPLIPPNLSYKMETRITEKLKAADEVSDDNEQDSEDVEMLATQSIKVFVIRMGQIQPVLAATINMPPTELSAII